MNGTKMRVVCEILCGSNALRGNTAGYGDWGIRGKNGIWKWFGGMRSGLV